MNLKECLVDKIIIAGGSTLKKSFFAVTENDLAEIGDYVQLKLSKDDLDNISKVDKIEELMENEFHYKDLVGKQVISEDAMTVGKIGDMIMDPQGCLIHNVLVLTGGAFNKKHLIISNEDINYIGDYVLLKITKEELEQKTAD